MVGMRFLGRRRPAGSPVMMPDVFVAREERAEARRQTEAERTDLVNRLTTRYYVASAIVATERADNEPFQSGVMDGIVQALSDVTGINETVIQYRLGHGIPPLAENWITTVDHAGRLWVLHNLEYERFDARLYALHVAALEAMNHPLRHYFVEHMKPTFSESV